MINSVRNTVLSILNKNNYGYISPADFNLFAKQAQIEIFEKYFDRYNRQITKENARQSGTGYADITGALGETIERFSKAAALLPKVSGEVSHFMTLPEDYYNINRMSYYSSLLSSGSITSVTAGRLVDSGATFTSDGISSGDVVVSQTTGAVAFVVRVVSDTEIILTKDIFELASPEYAVFRSTIHRELDKVTQSKIMMLNNSNLTAPTATFPVYVMSESESIGFGETVAVYPSSITVTGSVVIQYTRYPKTPKWTYSDVPSATGEPLFDSTQPDYQDFELPEVDEHILVQKILQYAGMSIREIALTQFGQAEEQMDDKQQG